VAKFMRVFHGSVALDDTRRACKVEQQDETARLTGIEPALLKKGATDTKVNVASFENINILQILNELKFVDVSTPQGASDAAALNSTHTLMFRCKMFVQDKLKDVEVFGRKTP
jgi:hypothetical protein